MSLLHHNPQELYRLHITTVWRRLLADEIEPAVQKMQETINKLPEAARKVLPANYLIMLPVSGEF